jgi:hypothetical protein
MYEEDYKKVETFKELYELVESNLERDRVTEGAIGGGIICINEARQAAVRIRKNLLAENPALNIPNVPQSADAIALMDYCIDAQMITDAAALLKADLTNSESTETDSQEGKFGFHKKTPKEQGES